MVENRQMPHAKFRLGTLIAKTHHARDQFGVKSLGSLESIILIENVRTCSTPELNWVDMLGCPMRKRNHR